jgi:poly(A) polymerase/tRNA nucleotidyltransferase (CCA-adding enzyme)
MATALLADPALTRLWAALPEARIVGGAVRDLIAHHPMTDIDLAVPLPPATVQTRLAAAAIRTIPTGLDHGTLTALIDGRAFEITSLRRDIATDGRHATVAFTDDWQTDAARRDFTINAMSMDRSGHIHDYFQGRADLAAGRVRFVGIAAARITEDYLRILRFFRFFARYAQSAPDSEAIAAIQTHRDGLARLSPERIWSELKRILAAANPITALALMEQTGILPLILPHGTNLPAARTAITNGLAPPLARFALLNAGPIDQVAASLRLSDAERTSLHQIQAAPALPPDANDFALRTALANHDRAALCANTYHAPGAEKLRARLDAMPQPEFPLRGADLIALGIPPGPAIGAALNHVRQNWLATGCTADRTACLAQLAAILDQPRPTKA